MAWSTPRAWASLELVTAGNMNTYISDLLTYLKGDAGVVTIDNGMNVGGPVSVTGGLTTSTDVAARYVTSGDGTNGVVSTRNGSLYLRNPGGAGRVVVDTGNGLQVAAGAVDVSPGPINTAAINSNDWFRVNTIPNGIYSTPAGRGMSIDASGLADYPSGNRLVDITTAQTLSNKVLADPDITGQVTLGGTSFTFPTVVGAAGTWRYVKAWQANVTILLTNGTFIIGTAQFGSGQYTLANGDSVSVYCDGSNWWVI